MPVVSEMVRPAGLSFPMQRKAFVLRHVRKKPWEEIAKEVRNLQGEQKHNERDSGTTVFVCSRRAPSLACLMYYVCAALQATETLRLELRGDRRPLQNFKKGFGRDCQVPLFIVFLCLPMTASRK